jgi:proteic killer suppression protein
MPARYREAMDVEFADKRLAAIETDEAAKTGLPVPVIRSARRKLTVLRAATDDRTLRNWKSLHYEKLKGDREGQRSIRVNDKYRIVFTIDNEAEPKKATILSIEDYHR